jgi:glycosyltransferase involved in cell wall biosynthesis
MTRSAPEQVPKADRPRIAYDARPLRPEVRFWGVGRMLDNLLPRLCARFEMVGLSFAFSDAARLGIVTWPVAPKLTTILFEASPLLVRDGSVYWGTNHFLPQFIRGRSVLTVHDLLLFRDPEGWEPAWYFVRRFVSALRRADRIVAVSKVTADDLVARFPALGRKIEVIHNAVDVEDVSGCPGESGSPARTDAPYVVMLGAHKQRKNLELAVAAVKQVRADKCLKLIVTGSVDQSYAELVRASAPIVELTGPLSSREVRSLLAGATALLFPSRYEGFGLPIIEAMALGCPVLALDTPISREVAGCAARLLPDDPRAWARAIERLVDSPAERDEMCKAGRENVARFSWDKAARQYSELFASLSR